MVALMILLRVILAPLLLIIATVLSLGAATGGSALIFNLLLDRPGADRPSR